MGLFSAIGSIAGSLIGGPTGGSIGGSIGGFLDGGSAASAASAASDAQNALMSSQANLYNLQADMGQHFYDSYKDNYEPLALSQLNAARVGVDPTYYANLASNNVAQNQALALQQAQRNMERAGVSPTDGRWLALQNQNALTLAGNMAGAQNKARQQAADTNWTRRNQMIDYGSNLLGRGSSMLSGAASGMGNLAGAYGQQAAAAGTAAGYDFNNAATGLMNYWNNRGSSDPYYGNQTYGTTSYGSNGGFGGWG